MTTTTATDYKVKDIGLADWGRREIGVDERPPPAELRRLLGWPSPVGDAGD